MASGSVEHKQQGLLEIELHVICSHDESGIYRPGASLTTFPTMFDPVLSRDTNPQIDIDASLTAW